MAGGRSRTLKIEILGDSKGLSKAFGEAERKADGFGASIGRGVGIAAVGVASVGVAAVGAAAIFGPQILEMGGQLEALGIKSKTVFEGSVGDVESWAAQNAKAMGLTNEQLVGAAAGFGDLIKPMGFTASEAAKMSTEALDLAGALSAWTGGTRSASEVSEILAKAMLGEREGLKELGISISEADVQARLLAKGQDQLTGAALEQAKALATQELIMEKSADAQAAWNNGSMDGIKAQNEMKASMASLQQGLVQALYPALQAIVPVVTQVATWLGENLPVAMAAVKDWVDENWPKIRDVIVTALEFVSGYVSGFVDTVTGLWEQHGDRIMTVVRIIFDYVKTTVESALKVVQGIMDVVMGLIRGDWDEVWNGIKGIFTGIWDQMKNFVETTLKAMGLVIDMAWETIKDIFRDAWESIKSTVSSAVTSIVEFIINIPGRIAGTVTGMFSGIGDAIYDAREKVREMVNQIVGYAIGLPGRMAGVFSGMWDGIKSAFRSAINFVIRGWNSLRFKMPSFEAFGQKIGGWEVGVPRITELAAGGVVKATPGGILARIGEAGRDEAVIPLDSAGGLMLPNGAGGPSRVYYIDVHVPPNVDMVAVGRVTVEAVQEFERVNGPGWRN